VDVTDTHFTIKARKEVIERFRATLLTRWVKFEMRVEADIGACELAARKVGKQINALEKVRANIDIADIKFVGKVAVVPCSVSLSAVDSFREAFRTQVTEVPSAPGGKGGASKKVRFARDKIPCDSAVKARDCYMSAVKVAKKWSRSGDRVKVFAYDGKPGSEICVTFSCEADAVEPFKEQVIKQVAFDDEKEAESLKFEGCRVHRAYDSPWTKKALEYVTRSADVSFMFTGRVKIFEHAVTGETALAEELPADVSRGRVPRVGPAPLWIETRRCAFSEYVLRSDGEMLTDEEEDKMAADVRETLDYFERNTFSIPYFRGRGFEALQNRLSVQFETRSQKIKFQKGSLCGTSESHRDVLKIPSAKHVFVIAKRTGEGPFGRTVEFVCEAASDDAKIPNFVRSVRTELMRLWQQSCIARRIVRLSLPAARVRIERRRECEKVRAEKMALRKEQMAESQAAASRIAKERLNVFERESVGTGGAPAMEKTPAPEHDSGDEEDDAIDFAASNPFGALLVVEESSVAATKGGASVAATKGGAAMVEPEKMAPKKKAKSKKGITLAVDYGVVGGKGGRK
jgi:hypothetical protein